MNCPGCGARPGRFAAHADTGEQFNIVTCTRNGVKYLLQQDVPRCLPMPGAKLLKRGKRGRRVGVDVEVLAAQQPRRRQSRPAHRPLRLAELSS